MTLSPPSDHPADRATARHRRRLRSVAVLAAAGAALLLGTGTAFAHVSVSPSTATPGGYTTLSFRVPNESDAANTTSVEIQLPAATPFGTVSAKQAPGWTVEVVTTKLPAPVTSGTVTLDEAVTSVRFTSDGTGLPPHQFTTFDLLVGPVPDVGSISFGAVQTYSDGEVVNWNEPTPASGEEPEHPAPVLTISGTPTDGHDDMPSVTAEGAASSATAADSTDVLARVLGIVGIVVGVLGVGFAVISRRSARSTSRTDGDRGGQSS